MQPIRWRGWFRLWLILSLILVPVVTVVGSQDYFNTWERLDRDAVKLCVDREDGKPENDATLCIQKRGLGKPYFERDHTTALGFWSRGLALVFVLDCILTGLIVALALAVRWIIRGFRSPEPKL